MRRYSSLLILAFFIAMISCDDTIPESATGGISDDNTYLTVEEVYDYAQQATNLLGVDKQGRSVSRKVNKNGIDVIISNNSSRTSNYTYPIYSVNFEDSMGYVLISGKRIENPILGIVQSGSFDNAHRNPESGLELFFECAYKYIESESVADNPSSRSTNISNPTFQSDPLIPVEWGQQGLYGELAPNGTAGCFSTALGQILCYLQKPESIALTYISQDTILPLDWTSIAAHANKEYKAEGKLNSEDCLFGTCRLVGNHLAISRLLRELGNRGQSTYNSNKTTGTNVTNIPAVIDGLGLYRTDFMPFNYNRMIGLLSQRAPLLMYGTQDNGKGHIWVCDSYLFTASSTTCMKPSGRAFRYYYYNWGHRGVGDGFFRENVFSCIVENDTSVYKNDVQIMAISNRKINEVRVPVQ